jgi:hypothetical protein
MGSRVALFLILAFVITAAYNMAPLYGTFVAVFGN